MSLPQNITREAWGNLGRNLSGCCLNLSENTWECFRCKGWVCWVPANWIFKLCQAGCPHKREPPPKEEQVNCWVRQLSRGYQETHFWSIVSLYLHVGSHFMYIYPLRIFFDIPELGALKCASLQNNKIFTWLQVLSNNTLPNSVHKFYASVPSTQQKTAHQCASKFNVQQENIYLLITECNMLS